MSVSTASLATHNPAPGAYGLFPARSDEDAFIADTWKELAPRAHAVALWGGLIFAAGMLSDYLLAQPSASWLALMVVRAMVLSVGLRLAWLTRRSLSSWTSQQFDPSLSWKDVEWIKRQWGGKLIVKGVLDPEDARLAADSGADALIVSNHGGRQLDGAPSSIAALAAIVEAVGSRMEVWLDGGIRSGQDVFKALALGASGTLIGRAFLYGLGAMGEAGVTRCLELIRNELDLTMAFCGLDDVSRIDRKALFEEPSRAPARDLRPGI